MKKFISVFTVFCVLLFLFACAETTAVISSEAALNAENAGEQEGFAAADGTSDQSKILIAYFSRADENYGVGTVEKGNTEIIAEMIAEETGGDLFHIERETAYPVEYDACTDEAKQERDSNARPALADDFSPDAYDVIYLGYPIWWGDMPMPVYTWLESHDFDGKTILPFCTHAGSGLSGTEENIRGVCPGADVMDGFALSGETAQNDYEAAKEAVSGWLAETKDK